MVDGHYVDTTVASTDTVVTVSKGIAGMITGGGHLINAASSGQYAGALGQKTTSASTCGRTRAQPACRATPFEGKASIQEITVPVAPVSVDGNATLRVTMTDAGEPGTSDKIGITVWNKAGGLWFSSNWSATNTVEQLLRGGNRVVR